MRDCIKISKRERMVHMKKLSVCLVIMMLIGLLSGVSFAEEKRVLRIGAVTDYTDNFFIFIN